MFIMLYCLASVLFHNWTEGHCFSLVNIFFSLFLMGSGQMVVVNRITDLCVSRSSLIIVTIHQLNNFIVLSCSYCTDNVI